jgi:Ni,Fe-hydrogenase III large subunit
MKYCTLNNNESVPLTSVPVLSYNEFYSTVLGLLKEKHCHCVNYYIHRKENVNKFICIIADDKNMDIKVTSFELDENVDTPIDSFTAHHFGMHVFERELTENFGIKYIDNPWLKPVRFPYNRVDKVSDISNYPFYSIKSHELNEVGVGPIHAGIIEPGHFRFICNGERVLHLEIHLGYQHRAVETMMVSKRSLLEKTILAESIAGDTVIGHTAAFANVIEHISGTGVSDNTRIERVIAFELERIAMHTADLSALCTDVAYQLGAAVLQGLRTTIINTFLIWCGNRFARKLIRCGYTHYPLSKELVEKIIGNIVAYESRYIEVAEKIFDSPSLLARFERTCIITKEQSSLINTVGMAARTTGINRDIRASHPYGHYRKMEHKPVILEHGDVMSRAMLRHLEIKQSVKYILGLLENYEPETEEVKISKFISLKPDSLSVSLTEGWRGEICHSAITDSSGNIEHYKIKDPSLHNWMALALAVRNNDISDFPVCNKSFNLSYCGYDL